MGDYHTSSTCNRPKIKAESNSILAFDELDRQCANYFLARKVAQKCKKEIDRILSQSDRRHDTIACRLISEGWAVLSEAQSALAHTCILMLSSKSAKITFLYEHMKANTQILQQKFEEVWFQVDRFPSLEARIAIHDLRLRLRDYLISVKSEIMSSDSNQNKNKSKAPIQESRKSPMRNRLRSMSDMDVPSNEYYDMVDRISTFSLQEKSSLAAAVFGDEFGGSGQIYRPL